MRLLRLLPVLVALGALSGTPALTGCDSGGGSSVVCSSEDVFTIEDRTPDDVALGAAIRSGDCVAVEYVGRLADGGVFARGTDFRFLFPNGEPNLARGFLLGMAGQRVGQTRVVTVPPDLAFGNQEIGAQAEGLVDIPSCATVQFEIRLKSISQDLRDCDR